MKTFLYLSIVVLSSSILLAQNYFPFPEDQRSFWKDGNQVVQYYCDQQEVIGVDTSLLLFGADYLFPEIHCLDSIIGFYYTNDFIFNNTSPFRTPPQVDSLIFAVGRLYPFGQADQFIQINAGIGEQWTVFPIEESAFDSISWSVLNISSTIWLENEEMTKIFEGLRYQGGLIVDTLQLVLSEEHGFLQYVSFDGWWVNAGNEQSLFGWFTETDKAGFTHSFENYFDLQVGSVFKYISRNIEYTDYRDILRDSVISSFINEEGLYYTVHRHARRENFLFESDILESVSYSYDTLDLYIPRSRYSEDFEATPGWFFGEETLASNDHWGYRKMDTLMLDTNNLVQVYADVGIPFSESSCEYNGVVDNFSVRPYRLGQGIGWMAEKTLSGAFYLTLLGYDTPNGSAGDYDPIEIITDVNTFDIEQNGLSVYPNPTNDWLHIKLESQLGKSAVISIKNMESKDVFMKVVSGLETDLNLNVQDLPKGVYTVVIITDEKIYSSLFVKF